ncbi:hypothetical protein [Psychrobacillus sp. L4]|uniref:hypothetical protein n=1 Tax=Psychrobacillus sp. L4 TaxID=3236892 RepID=UPI0036F3E90A
MTQSLPPTPIQRGYYVVIITSKANRKRTDANEDFYALLTIILCKKVVIQQM